MGEGLGNQEGYGVKRRTGGIEQRDARRARHAQFALRMQGSSTAWVGRDSELWIGRDWVRAHQQAAVCEHQKLPQIVERG